jgi:hypothetical protein
MLTDVFVTRYSNVLLFKDFEPRHRKLIVQGFRLLEERICPYGIGSDESAAGKAFWTDLQSRMAMELGLKSLANLAYAYTTAVSGKAHTITGTWTMNKVCEDWMLKEFDAGVFIPDEFIKERLSLIELGFRKRREDIDAILRSEGEVLALLGPARGLITESRRGRHTGDPKNRSRADALNIEFASAVDELNTRFRQAGCDLHYHNGFIQISTDQLLAAQIDQPFWSVVGDPKWKNVDHDIKEALDQRDTGGRDPAFYAARGLESTIKIICAERGGCGERRRAHTSTSTI